ncbi:MAG: efflux RND transporter permease subunit [Ignavibacteria bacterium]|nr:efflux RND transporter permease subunit [Ignavibacteria bacterium]
MKLSEYAVKNPQLTLLVFLMAVILGINTILNMPRSEDPEINIPEFPIVIIYPGTSPADMENLVVDPLEKKLSGLEDVKKVTSVIKDGLAVVDIRYKHGSNVDDKYQEVIREVNNMRNELPQDIYSIEIQKLLPSNVNILQVALVSENANLEKIRRVAEDFKDELGKLHPLKNVEIHGLPEKIVRVELKLDKMSAMHIPLEAVLGSVQSEGINIPGGNVHAGTKTFNIKTSGNYKNLNEVENTIVYAANGRNILLKDLADVYFDFVKERHITRLNGHRSIFVVAALKPGENISQVQKIYKPVVEKFKKTLPKNIDAIAHFDQAENVNRRLGGLGVDLLIAIGLVALTLLPLGSRATMIVMVSIPLSLAIGIVLIHMFGFTLNQLSIVGLVVALGLLVDDSIVVIENIERWLRDGHSRFEATVKATKQISIAVIGTTATLIIAFMPLAFLPEVSGDFIRSLPAAVIASVFASMIVSLSIIPFLANKLLKEHEGNPEGNIFLRGLKKIIRGTYSKLLDKALDHPVKTLAITGAVFAGSLMLFPVIGFSLFPASEKPQFLIEITTPLQSNIDYTNKVTKEIEHELKEIPEVKYFASNVGKGNPQIYYNVMQENEHADFAQIFVQLDNHTSPKEKLALIETLRKKWSSYLGAKVEVKNFEQGPPVLAPVEVRLFGDNLDTLRTLAGEVEEMIKNTEGTIYVKNLLSNLKSDIRVNINKEKAHMLGVPTVNIAKTVRLAIAGFDVAKLTDDKGDNFDVLVTKSRKDLTSLSALENLYVNNLQGKPIPLPQVASFHLESSPVQIDHYNKTRMTAITAHVKKGYLNDNVIQDVITKMDKKKLPEGFHYEMGGELESRQESFGGFGAVIIVTLFLFVIVLVLEFKTFKSTAIVLSVIPLGIVGAVLALLITGNSLSFVAIIGLIALAGIEVKNTILLVDFTNQLRKQGKSLHEAIREAGEIRFLPIILTSLTAIGGLIPIAVSTNQLISPLAIVVIGGLISSTLLSRVVTPVVYQLIPPKINGSE